MSNTAPQAPLLRVENLSQRFVVESDAFGRPSRWLRAVEDVSFDLHAGETLGVVGESGCGKSTLARSVLHLYKPSSGTVTFEGRALAGASSAELRGLRQHMQIVLQDPYGALNPRRSVGSSIADGLTGDEKRARAGELLQRVGLRAEDYVRYPHEFSGGQRQRICIARALAPQPRLLIADEAVSALDVSVQAQILNLLSQLRADFDLSFLFISHNLSVVRAFCDRVAVMYLGRVVEIGPAEIVFTDPAHPYTRALIAAVPVPDPRRQHRHVPLRGELPSPLNPPSGCAFRTRCPHAADVCAQSVPALTAEGAGRQVACHRLPIVERGPVWLETKESSAC
jgi:oligopeptide/dipeptide ABC transporter ATP-binding protein